MMNRKILLLSFPLLLLAACQQEAKLECPQAQPTTSNSALRETAADIKSLQGILADGTQGNAVNEIIFNLKKKYPEATDAEISNYLATVYCPVVAGQDRSLDDAKAKIERFNTDVQQILSQ